MKVFAKVLLVVVTLGLVFVFVFKNYNLSIYFEQIGAESTMNEQDKYIENLRQAMLQRQSTITLDFKGSGDDVHGFVSDAINLVFEVDNPNTNIDYDYLRYTYKGTEITIKGLFNAYRIEYKFNYNETKEQTDIVLKHVRGIVKTLGIDAMDDYNKIKTIHDYIVQNATYDISSVHASGYDNLVGRTSVCQGYAMITYLMMKEAGIDCRIITGSGKGISHAWNIVQLDGLWYNIDCTWDDPVSSDGKQHLEYDYFLKADHDFTDHIRDFEYETLKFREKYKMADISY